MMKKIDVGLIGLGFIGNVHLKHLLKMPDVNLVGVSDLSKRALRKAKNAGAKKTFTSYEQLLKEPNLDAVLIALPTHLHLPCVTQAAEAGKHILLEKPIARNLEEAKEIVSLARKNSIKIMMGYPLRFNDAFLDIKAKKENGTIGDVEIAQATYLSSGPFFHRAESHIPVPVPEWWLNKSLTGGGALIDVGSHIINLLRWYFGEITHIKSHLGHRFNLDIEDSAICFAKFESGTRAVITTGWFMQGYQLKVELLGTVDQAVAQYEPEKSIKKTLVQFVTNDNSKFYRPFFNEIVHFVNSIKNDSLPSPSALDGLKDLEAINEAYKNSIL